MYNNNYLTFLANFVGRKQRIFEMEQSTTPLLGLTLHELKDVAKALGMPALQGHRWLNGYILST